MMTGNENTPTYWEGVATQAQAEDRWLDAANAWMRARGYAFGFKRRERYWEAEQYCREMAKAGAA